MRVPAYSPNAVAEHAVALLMCLNRNLHKAYARVREGDFTPSGLVGFDVVGKTVGVVGTGRSAWGEWIIFVLRLQNTLPPPRQSGCFSPRSWAQALAPS